MEDNISLEVKEARLQELNKLINDYSNMNNQKYLEKIVSDIKEGKAKFEEHELIEVDE